MDKGVAQAHQVRTIVTESNPLVVSALRVLFEQDPRFRLVAAVASGAELLDAAERGEVDLAVIAWKLVDGGAAEVLREMKDRHVPIRVVVLSNDDDPNLLRRAARLGAHGYCYQSDEPMVIFETLHAVSCGRMCMPDIDMLRLADTPLGQLTVRERELLDMLARGWSNQQISNRTGISENTVKYHLKNLYDKLTVRNRAMAVALYSKEKGGQ